MTKIINGVASEFEFPADTGVFTQNILEKENEILRKNAEHNDKVVDKVNWENMLLKKENQELKKQLKPDYYTKGLEGTLIEYQQEMNKVVTQQQEFINYLEDEIKSSSALDTINKQTAMYIYSTTLKKYKEIIGVSDENN